MTPPETAGANLAAACLLGALSGLVYGFLRPLRRRSAWAADSIFVLFTFLVWLYLGFGICGGDLRLGYWMGLLTGGFLWEMTAGRLLQPVFSGFWKCLFLLVDIPTGYTHNIENVGEGDMVTVMWANEPFDPEHPDTFFLKV